MGKLAAMPSEAIISGFKGVVDFYDWCGIPCFRKWPESPGSERSPAVEAQWPSFSYSAGLWKELSLEIQETYNTMATGTGLTGRDMFTRAYIKGLFTYAAPVEEEMKIIWLPASIVAWSQNNVNADIAYTDLDLSAHVSGTAKFAILSPMINSVDTLPNYRAWFKLRKNGTTSPAAGFSLPRDALKAGQGADTGQVIIALDDDKKIEYSFHCHNSGQFDLRIELHGYYE